MKALTRVAAFALASGAVAFALPALAESKVLTNKDGMTVYTFDKDASGKSNCNGNCAVVWPPASIESVPAGADISVITRDDGSKQAAFKGKPIYQYAADQKPGDTTGDGVNNVWHVISLGQPAKAGKAPASTGGGYGY